MPYVVCFTPQAERDVENAAEWIHSLSRDAAQRWRTRLVEVIGNLETNPYGYPVAEEAEDEFTRGVVWASEECLSSYLQHSRNVRYR